MTERDWKELGRYVRWCANELGLRDWTITLERTPPVHSAEDGEMDALGECSPVTGRRAASVFVCADFRDRKPEEQREVVLHELLHCHTIPIMEPLRADVCNQLSQQAYNLAMAATKRQMELATDGIASAIAKHFPLIKWPRRCSNKRTAKGRRRKAGR